MLSYVSAALVATTAYAASAEYSQNGANWGETTPLCKDGLEQSPIDLKDATVSNNIELIGFNYFNYNGSNSDALADNALRQGNMPSP